MYFLLPPPKLTSFSKGYSSVYCRDGEAGLWAGSGGEGRGSLDGEGEGRNEGEGAFREMGSWCVRDRE